MKMTVLEYITNHPYMMYKILLTYLLNLHSIAIYPQGSSIELTYAPDLPPHYGGTLFQGLLMGFSFLPSRGGGATIFAAGGREWKILDCVITMRDGGAMQEGSCTLMIYETVLLGVV